MSSTLIHGEAYRELLAMEADSIDAVIADPPYSSGGMHRSDRIQDTGSKYVQTGTVAERPDFDGDNRDQRSYLAWSTLWLGECLRILRPGRAALVFTDWRQLPITSDSLQAAGFIWRGVIVWDKTESSRPNLGFNSQAEYLVWGTRGPTDLGHNVYLPGVIRAPVPRGDERWHQTQKPLGLLERLAEIAPRGGTILDPFMGSGTTLVAARNRGRHGIGIELSDSFVERAAKRLDQLALGEVA